jgi:hypothetical protein
VPLTPWAWALPAAAMVAAKTQIIISFFILNVPCRALLFSDLSMDGAYAFPGLAIRRSKTEVPRQRGDLEP